MMRAGGLRHRITIQRPVVTQDATGQPIEEWQTVATVWAQIEDISGREYFAARQVPANDVTARITIRWRNDITPFMKVRAGERMFDIQSVIDSEGRKRKLELMCREAV